MKQLSLIILLVSLSLSCVESWRVTNYIVDNEYVYPWYKDKSGTSLTSRRPCIAEFWVGLQYYLGQGKPYDEEKAILLWEIAANANRGFAQLALGDLYYQDENTDWLPHHCKTCNINKDLVQAYFWYKIAELNYYYHIMPTEYAELMLKVLKIEMTNEEIEKGNRMVNSWRASFTDCKPRDFWD